MTAAANYYEQEKNPESFEETVLSIETALQAADPATAQKLLDDAGAWLGQVYDSAQQSGDQPALLAITTAWSHMQAIKVQADTATDLAHSAVAGMKAAIEQRDEIAGELEELTVAVEFRDNMHTVGVAEVDLLIEFLTIYRGKLAE